MAIIWKHTLEYLDPYIEGWLDFWFPAKHTGAGLLGLMLMFGGLSVNAMVFWLPISSDIFAQIAEPFIPLSSFYAVGQFINWALFSWGLWTIWRRSRVELLRFYAEAGVYSTPYPLRSTWEWDRRYSYVQDNDDSHDIAVDMRSVVLRDSLGEVIPHPYTAAVLKQREAQIMEMAKPFSIPADMHQIDSGDLHERLEVWEMAVMHSQTVGNNLPMALGTVLVTMGGLAFMLYDTVNQVAGQ